MDIIKFGSIVSISHIQDEDALMGGDGFIKNSVILKGMSPLHKPNTKEFTINYLSNLNMPNCLFIVCPRTSNGKKAEIDPFINKKEPGIMNDDVTDQRSEITPAKSQIKSLAHSIPPIMTEKKVRDNQVMLFNEFKFNVDGFEKEKGNNVKYEEPIQFLHLASSMWLSSLPDQEAKFENQNYKLTLVDYTSDSTLFKIVPTFKYQKEGDQIVYSQEIVRIMRMFPLNLKPTFLHCSGEIPLKSIKEDIYSVKGKIQKREINASIEESTSWKINLYSQQLDLDGELVWIHHSETCSQLAIEYDRDLNNSKVCVFSSDPSELSFDNYSGNAYSLWIIENENYKIGGQFKYQTKYRLKHFHTGLYLACVRNLPQKEEDIKIDPYGKKKVIIPKTKKAPVTFTLQVIPNRDALFLFEPIKFIDRQEIGTDFIQIKNDSQNKYLDVIQKGNQEGTQLKPTILNKKNEHAVFKLFRANRNESKEVLFLDSCTKQLLKYKYYINLPFKFEQNNQVQQLNDDIELLKIKQKKLKTAQKCIQNLDEFIRQKILCSTPQQKYGFIALKRQRLMKDQHFFDVLLQILTTTVNKQDLDTWSNKKTIIKEQPSLTVNTRRKQVQGISEKEKMELSIQKVELCNQIFILLQTSVTGNIQNQIYLFDKLPQYQHYCKYLSLSINFLIEMVKSNEKILINLCNNLRIDFDYMKKQEITEDLSKKVKVLINFYEKDVGLQQDIAIPIKVHDRIITRPVNIVQYFFNLLVDDTAKDKDHYFRFLRHICKYKTNSISVNQENLFKLFKKYANLTKLLQIETENCKILNKDPIICNELLQFFAEVAYGRNYLWKEELVPLFTQKELIDQIWEQQPQEGKIDAKPEEKQRPYLCKLSRSLYIDQQPYRQLIVPNFCRLFHNQINQDQIQNYQEIDTKFQLEGLFKFLKMKKKKIKQAIQFEQSFDILNDELTFNAAEQILTMLQLDIMPPKYYKKIIQCILQMFVYDRKSLPYLKAAIKSYKDVIKSRIKGKDKSMNVLGLGNMFDGMKGLIQSNDEDKNDQGEEEEKEEVNLFDQPKLFLNPIMCGFMSMSNKLESLITLPKVQLEIEFKLKVCSILDHFLDRRQNFLISNIVLFFHKYEYTDDDLSDEEDDQTEKAASKMFDNNYKTLIPQIAQTGLDEIDDQQESQDIFPMTLNKPQTFVDYFQKFGIEAKDEFLEIDQYFSLAQKDISKKEDISNQDKKVASIFPYLMSTYFLVKDQVLEERCLNVIMRVFNQREELRENMKKLQILFDDDKTAIYAFIDKQQRQLSLYVEQTEIWLTQFRAGHHVKELDQCINIITELSKCMLTSVQIDGENLIIQEVQTLNFDIERQSIITFLKVHEIIVNLIQNGMSHFVAILSDEYIEKQRKQEIMKLFQNSFTFLTYYCTNNRGNQLILYQYMETFLQFIQYDVGQGKLLIEIFKDNPRLLNTGVKQLIQRLTEVIEREGRQAKFIDILCNLIIIGDKYLLENQMLILNTFLPMRDLNETELRLLYAEGSKQKELRFYLDDQFLQPEENLLNQLEAIDWKDCYRDEPFLYQQRILDLLLQTSLIDLNVRNYEFKQVDGFNISVFKLKKIFKPIYLIELLRQEDDMVEMKQKQLQFAQILQMQAGNIEEQLFDKKQGYSILKPTICEFLTLVHIVSEKNNAQEGPISQLSRQFILFIEFEIKKLDQVFQEANYKPSYVNYIVDQIIPLLIYYHQRVLSVQQEDVKKTINEFSIQFAQVLCKYFYKELFKATQLIIISKFREYYDNQYYTPAFTAGEECCILHLENAVDYKKEEEYQMPEQQKQSSIQKKSQIKASNMFSSMGLNLNINLNSNKSKHKRADLTAEKMEKQWNKFIIEMCKSQKMEEQIELEKQALADAIINVEKLVTKECDIKPTQDRILKKFIIFLQTAVLQQENKGTIVILLKIMSKIIEKQEQDETKKKFQELFDNLGATRMVLNVITDYSKLISSEMLYYLISFINVLLGGGNTQVQNTIYTFCQTQQKSEVMFQTFAKFLEKAATQGRDENEDEEEAEMQNKIVNCILKFFQNCTEGHYQEMQNYIRYQYNSRASKDLINLVADLFKNYDRTQNNFNNLTRCLDTLNELVQGPCSENQIAVADSKFFDVVQEMFPLRKQNVVVSKQSTVASIKKQTDKKRKSQLSTQLLITRGMKAQLQNKILVLILSLLENREIKGKNSIIKRIMRVLPMNVLERHLSKIYKKWYLKYQGNYNMMAFNHIKLDCVQMAEDDPTNKDCEIIIQNGFYIMFLICYYMESDEDVDSIFLTYNKQYLRSQNKENSLFDPNSTIGQLFALGMELYELSLLKTQQMLMELKKTQQDSEEFQQEQIKQKLEEKKRRLKKAFMFFRSHTAHIEVVRDDQIELVFFPLLPFSRLNKDEKQQFQQTVDRSSAKSKVQDLMEKSNELIQIMKHEEEMNRFYKQYKIIGFFANYIQLWKDLAFYLTLVINVMIIGSFSHQSDPEREKDEINNEALNEYIFFRKDEWTHDKTVQLINTLGIAMMICSLFVVIFVLARIAPLIIKKALEKKNIMDGQGIIKLLINWLAKFFFVLFYCLKDVQLLYYLGYGTLAVIGTFVHPFFFCFHLSVILIRYPTLSNVVRAVTMPWQQLVLTLLLIIIITYIFTLIAFYALQESFELQCKEVYLCFLQIFDKNFKVPGGIGGNITNNNPSPNFQIFRYLYDQINNLLLVIIMISIASGIIIDTFGQLREDENKMTSDIKDKCFICGQENIIFERSSDGSSGGFKNHIRQNHYMWNYLYYIAYLQWKDTEDYSGIESFVAKKIKDTDLSWIPFGKARELQRGEDEKEKQARQMDTSSQNLLTILDHSKDIIKALKSKKEQKKHQITLPTQQREQIISQQSMVVNN